MPYKRRDEQAQARAEAVDGAQRENEEAFPIGARAREAREDDFQQTAEHTVERKEPEPAQKATLPAC